VSELILVRHGQASLFTDDYDRLSELGVGQSRALGSAWLEEELSPDIAWSGTLKRQIDTAAAVGDVFAKAGRSWPDVQLHDGLNEYPGEEIVTTLGRHLRGTDPAIAALADAYESSNAYADRYRHLHRLLEAVIARWVEGDYEPSQVPVTWRDWSEAVRGALADIMTAAGSGRRVAVFTSGGPIAVSVQTVLSAPDIKAAELNWRINNCSVTRYTWSGERISLDRFNDIAHLPRNMRTFR